MASLPEKPPIYSQGLVSMYREFIKFNIMVEYRGCYYRVVSENDECISTDTGKCNFVVFSLRCGDETVWCIPVNKPDIGTMPIKFTIDDPIILGIVERHIRLSIQVN